MENSIRLMNTYIHTYINSNTYIIHNIYLCIYYACTYISSQSEVYITRQLLVKYTPETSELIKIFQVHLRCL